MFETVAENYHSAKMLLTWSVRPRVGAFYLLHFNKVSLWWDVTLLARHVLSPGELRCICECYRRRQTTYDDRRSDRY